MSVSSSEDKITSDQTSPVDINNDVIPKMKLTNPQPEPSMCGIDGDKLVYKTQNCNGSRPTAGLDNHTKSEATIRGACDSSCEFERGSDLDHSTNKAKENKLKCTECGGGIYTGGRKGQTVNERARVVELERCVWRLEQALIEKDDIIAKLRAENRNQSAELLEVHLQEVSSVVIIRLSESLVCRASWKESLTLDRGTEGLYECFLLFRKKLHYMKLYVSL